MITIREKKEQKVSFDLVILVVVSLVAFILLFVVVLSSHNKSAGQQKNVYSLQEVINDGVIDDNELSMLSSMSCEELKSLIGTDKRVCIYFKDINGELLDVKKNINSLSSNTIDTIKGIGCPGFVVDGEKICG
ncbi:MAG: hypothetical protein QXK37_00975 [Candidatus Woesearchaeota archaeon]